MWPIEKLEPTEGSGFFILRDWDNNGWLAVSQPFTGVVQWIFLPGSWLKPTAPWHTSSEARIRDKPLSLGVISTGECKNPSILRDLQVFWREKTQKDCDFVQRATRSRFGYNWLQLHLCSFEFPKVEFSATFCRKTEEKKKNEMPSHPKVARWKINFDKWLCHD